MMCCCGKQGGYFETIDRIPERLSPPSSIMNKGNRQTGFSPSSSIIEGYCIMCKGKIIAEKYRQKGFPQC